MDSFSENHFSDKFHKNRLARLKIHFPVRLRIFRCYRKVLICLQHCLQQDARFKFGRSNSHSHTSGRAGRKSASSPSVESTVCHKSLPDLHTSTRRRASLSPRASTKSTKPSGHHQSSNNCPDCETSSDYSEHSFKRDAVCYRRYSTHYRACFRWINLGKIHIN